MNPPQDTPDWNPLIARVLSGDKRAAEDLAEKLGVLAYNYFRRADFGLPREDAEELAQDLVVRVIARLRQFDGRNFNGWVFKILHSLLMEHYRQRSRRVQATPLLDNDTEPTPPEVPLNGHLSAVERAALEEAFAQLKPNEITLIESQTGFEKVPFVQIGKELKISKDKARVCHHRAKEKLETILRKDPRMKSWLARHQSQKILNSEHQKHETAIK